MLERQRAFAAGFAVDWFFKANLQAPASSCSGTPRSPLWDEHGRSPLSACLAVTSAWLMWRRCLTRWGASAMCSRSLWFYSTKSSHLASLRTVVSPSFVSQRPCVGAVQRAALRLQGCVSRCSPTALPFFTLMTFLRSGAEFGDEVRLHELQARRRIDSFDVTVAAATTTTTTATAATSAAAAAAAATAWSSRLTTSLLQSVCAIVCRISPAVSRPQDWHGHVRVLRHSSQPTHYRPRTQAHPLHLLLPIRIPSTCCCLFASPPPAAAYSHPLHLLLPIRIPSTCCCLFASPPPAAAYSHPLHLLLPIRIDATFSPAAAASLLS